MKKSHLTFLAGLFLLLAFSNLEAQRFRVGFVHYKPLGGLDYEVVMMVAIDSIAPPPPDSIPMVLDDPGLPGPELMFWAHQDLSQTVPNGIRTYRYLANITLPVVGQNWFFNYKGCCRGPLDNMNPGSDSSYSLSARLDLSVRANSTARFDNFPVTFARRNHPYYYNPGFYDEEHDSLTFRIEALKDTTGPFGSPNVGWNPPIGLTIDSLTGEMFWMPADTGHYGFRMTVKEWTQGGAEIGQAEYDMIIIVKDLGASQAIDFINTTGWPTNVDGDFEFTATINQAFTLIVEAQDPDGSPAAMVSGGENLSITVSTATFAPVNLNDSTVRGTYTWTPDVLDDRTAPYVVVFRAEESTWNYTPATEVTVYIVTQPAVGIDETLTTEKANLKLWPNPASTSFAVEFSVPITQEIQMEIFDLQGRRVHFSPPQRVEKGKAAFLEMIDGISPGTYIIKITGDEGLSLATKLLKM